MTNSDSELEYLKAKSEALSIQLCVSIVDDYLNGATEDLARIVSCLQNIKKGLEYFEVFLLKTFISSKMQKSKDVIDIDTIRVIQNFYELFRGFLDKIDLALFFAEKYPEHARLMTRAVLMLSHIELKDITTLIDILKELLETKRASSFS